MLGGKEGNINIKHIIIPPLPVGYILGLKIITVTFRNTKYIIYNTPTKHSMPVIHVLLILGTCMPQYHKFILPRAKMGIFNCTPHRPQNSNEILTHWFLAWYDVNWASYMNLPCFSTALVTVQDANPQLIYWVVCFLIALAWHGWTCSSIGFFLKISGQLMSAW